jgi:hypothetical protein
MGCHTWVYTKRKQVDNTEIEQLAKELCKADKQYWLQLKTTFRGMPKQTLHKFLLLYAEKFKKADDLPIGKERIAAFDKVSTTFVQKYGKQWRDFITYLFYTILGCDEDAITDDVDWYASISKHISSIDKSNNKYYSFIWKNYEYAKLIYSLSGYDNFNLKKQIYGETWPKLSKYL